MKAPNRLRVLRAEKRVTQERLEARTKISQTRISQIENGYVEATSDERRLLAKALRVNVADAFPPDQAVSR